jgi:hypothetical protein
MIKKAFLLICALLFYVWITSSDNSKTFADKTTYLYKRLYTAFEKKEIQIFVNKFKSKKTKRVKKF